MADSASDVSGDKDTQTAILVQRRCIILAIVGSTPSSNSSLGLVLENGFLSSAKSWLDDILNGSIGELLATCFLVGLISGLRILTTGFSLSPFPQGAWTCYCICCLTLHNCQLLSQS